MKKTEKLKKRVPPTGQTALTVVKTSSSKSDALKVAELQIGMNITCHDAVRSIDHPATNEEF